MGPRIIKVTTHYHWYDDPLPHFGAAKGYYIASQIKKIALEVGFMLFLKLKKWCIVEKKRAAEVS